MAYIVTVDDKKFKVAVEKQGKEFKVKLDDKEFLVEIMENKAGLLNLIINNKSYTVFLEDEKISVGGEEYNIEIIDEKIKDLIKSGKGFDHKKEVVIKAPMPGLIVEVEVNPGDKVKPGQGLIIVEAMKMQNEMKTPKDGVVKQINVKKGQTVNSGDTLIIIE